MFLDFYALYIAQWQNNNNKITTTYIVKTREIVPGEHTHFGI